MRIGVKLCMSLLSISLATVALFLTKLDGNQYVAIVCGVMAIFNVSHTATDITHIKNMSSLPDRGQL